MKPAERSKVIVVGIDGASSAVHAAQWAVDEAVSRDIPLRLVHVIQSTATDIHREMDDAETALQQARSAVTGTGHPVKVETAILRGPVAGTLSAQSAEAAMVCVGSVGADPSARKYLGATGAAVARHAHCQVAIVRTHGDEDTPAPGEVAVVIDDPVEIDSVLQVALEEARLRHTAVLVLTLTSWRIHEVAPEQADCCVTEWLRRYPDVPSRVLMVSDDIAAFLAQHSPPVQLAVAANSGDGTAGELVRPCGRLLLRDTDCSVLLVQPRG
jgi:nucleotide-binding universal stress UspA family protein